MSDSDNQQSNLDALLNGFSMSTGKTGENTYLFTNFTQKSAVNEAKRESTTKNGVFSGATGTQSGRFL